jgi:hypothetical protein
MLVRPEMKQSPKPYDNIMEGGLGQELESSDSWPDSVTICLVTLEYSFYL